MLIKEKKKKEEERTCSLIDEEQSRNLTLPSLTLSKAIQ